ncbi:MAG: integrase core domain-containing protein [Actinomyces graevenitzii]|nr:integrase core domain-containing protein [Actinomyces graevenitzii]
MSSRRETSRPGTPRGCGCARAKPPSPALRRACSAWSQRYNEEHPHSALGWLSPNQYARQWAQHH